MAEEETYTITFDKPVPINLFVAVMEGIERRYPGSKLAMYQTGGVSMTITLGEEVTPDDDDLEYDPDPDS